VTREQLQRALWPDDTFGDFDEGLNKAIQKLRQALDDSTGKPQFIETLPRKGYRFIAAVESVADGAATPVLQERRRTCSREVLAWVLVGMLSLALGVLAAVHFRQQPTAPHAVRFQISPPDKVIQSPCDIPRVSPDGRHMVISGRYQLGVRRLWIRSLDSLVAQPLPDTEGACFPFWSPDSRFVAFFKGDKLKSIDIAGGPSRVLSDAPFPVAGGAWSQDGTILIGSVAGYLRHVSATGSKPAKARSRATHGQRKSPTGSANKNRRPSAVTQY
jgi:hypothetical protein